MSVRRVEELQRSGALQRQSFRVASSHAPSAFMDSNFTQSRRLLARTGGLTGIVSPLTAAPLPLSNQGDAQVKDGHAMVKFDHFPIIPELEPRSAWRSLNFQNMRTNKAECTYFLRYFLPEGSSWPDRFRSVIFLRAIELCLGS